MSYPTGDDREPCPHCHHLTVIDDLDGCEHCGKHPEPRECAFGDPHCPCQDGDPCHYVDHGNTKAMKAPA